MSIWVIETRKRDQRTAEWLWSACVMSPCERKFDADIKCNSLNAQQNGYEFRVVEYVRKDPKE